MGRGVTVRFRRSPDGDEATQEELRQGALLFLSWRHSGAEAEL